MLTVEDYLRTPDGERWELLNGELHCMEPAPLSKHQILTTNLFRLLFISCKDDVEMLPAPIDLYLSNNTVVQPDLIILTKSNYNVVTRRGVEGVPDIVVEILSESSFKKDRKDKLVLYQIHQIPEYWIVDPDNKLLEQYVLHRDLGKYIVSNVYGSADIICSPNIECIAFSMDELFGVLEKFNLD